jgi:beta-galactosidase
MVTFKEKQIMVDGTPIFLLSGELHYFRQPRENWQHLLDEAKAMGLNCIASYIPWILHEETEGNYCFEDNLDLGAFIDLCNENGLYFFVRPGPFIMAEMKNEGLPYWVAKKHPEAVPVGFDGEQRPSTTLDYLNAGYLEECRRWYKKVMKIIAPRLQCSGGNIIGVQIDNEIGMLNWVSNHPLLNDNVIKRFSLYLYEQYSQEELNVRYPFDIKDTQRALNYFRSPAEDYAAAFHLDYGTFMRRYYAEYVHILKQYAEESGIHHTPFFINIHGTGSSRIFDFPLGISQLYQAYNMGEGMISGTDVYLGEPTEGKYQDLYVINALTDCMNKKGNPLTSIEFECSDGPYCSLSGMRYHPTATSHKMLMCLSQNARMLNFYVFSGGENYLLNHPENDGNGRMAFTGELHGYGAPVQPDGSHNYSFEHIGRTARAIHALNGLIASSRQKLDNVTMGFIPDYFLTEASYPSSVKVKQIHNNLKKWRCEGSIDSIARALLGQNICFDAVDIQHDEIPDNKTLIILSARYMPKGIQQKLINYALKGGKLLIYGELPEYDLEGNSCTLLLNALKLDTPSYIETDHPSYFLTLKSCGSFEKVTTAQRATMAQCFSMDEDAILTPFDSHSMCGMIKSIGKGKVCAITSDYPADMKFYSRVFAEMSIEPSITAPHYRQGIYLARTESEDGQQLIYIINLDAAVKTVNIIMDGKVLFENFVLTEKASYILPINVKAAGATIVKSTAEITAVGEESISFRLSQFNDVIVLKTEKVVLPGDGYTISHQSGETIITSVKQDNNMLIIKLA